DGSRPGPPRVLPAGGLRLALRGNRCFLLLTPAPAAARGPARVAALGKSVGRRLSFPRHLPERSRAPEESFEGPPEFHRAHVVRRLAREQDHVDARSHLWAERAADRLYAAAEAVATHGGSQLAARHDAEATDHV